MAKYYFNYLVVEEWTASFEADSDEQAQALYDDVVKVTENPQGLPDFDERNRNINYEFPDSKPTKGY